MSYQEVRRVFEAPVSDALADLDVPVTLFVDNQPFVDADAAEEYAVMRLDFGQANISALQSNIEFLRGSLVVEVFCPKNRGPGRAQVVIQAVIEALLRIGTCGPKPTTGAYGRLNELTGPSFYAMDNKPFFSARCGAGFIASYN